MDRRTFIKAASALSFAPRIAMGSPLSVVGPMHLDLSLAIAECGTAFSENEKWRSTFGESEDGRISHLFLENYRTASNAALEYIAQQPIEKLFFGMPHLSEEAAWIVGGMNAKSIILSMESVSVDAARALCAQGVKHNFFLIALRNLDSHAAEHIVSASQGNVLNMTLESFGLHPDLAQVLAENDEHLLLDLGDIPLQAESARELSKHSGQSLRLNHRQRFSADVENQLTSNPMKSHPAPIKHVCPFEAWSSYLFARDEAD